MPYRGPRTTRLAGIAVAATLVVAVPSAASATAGPDDLLVATGDVQILVAESADGQVVDSQAVVVIDGVMIPLPADRTADLEPGATATVTLTAPGADTLAEVLDRAADPGTDAPVEVVDVAQVAEAAAVDPGAVPTADAGGEPGLAAATQARTLTVLPVTWSSADTSTSTLTTMAGETAAFWAAQSAGGYAFSTSVRDWRSVSAPASCAIDQVTALFNRALAAHGHPAPTDRDHVAVYFPSLASCGWVGLATLGGGAVWINGMPTAEVLAHELGHNFGLGHANELRCTSGGVAVPLSSTCTAHEYRDQADTMGWAIRQAPGNLTMAFADRLGFGRTLAASPSATLTTDLAPLGQVGQVRAVRIPMPDGSALYVDYRPATGRDTRAPGWAGVQVHRIRPGERFPDVELLQMNPGATNPVALPAGRSFTFPGSGYSLRVDSVTASAARVTVTPTNLDKTPPAAVGLTAPLVPVVVSPVRVSWEPSTDALSGVAGYSVLVDGVAVVTTGPTTTTAAVPMSPGEHEVRIRTADVAGNTATGPGMTVKVLEPVVTFSDVPTYHPFFAEITWLARTGITEGYADSTFGAERAVSRAAMAAFLYRAAGSPQFTPPATSPFVDVHPAHPFYREITWLAREGISTGTATPAGAEYRPNEGVSRGAMAAFLYRFSGQSAAPPTSATFVDVQTWSPFSREITWLASTGITTGYTDGTFRPATAIPRSAMAAFLCRFDTRVAPLAGGRAA